MSAGHFDSLLACLLDDEPSPSDLEALAVHLTEHPEAAREVRRQLHLAEMLAGELTWSRSAEAFASAAVTRLQAEESAEAFTAGTMRTVMAEEQAHPHRRFTWGARRILALAASALVVAGVWWMRAGGEGRGTVARVTEQKAEVRSQRAGGEWADLKAGDEIRAGDRIETGTDGAVTLAWVGEATTVDLGGDSEFGIPDSKRAELKTGRLMLHVDRQVAGAPFVVATPHAKATVTGTRLSLDVGPLLTRLEVTDGRVLFRRLADGREVEVPAGRWAHFGDVTCFAEGAREIALDTGLAGWWKLDETEGVVMHDSSGHGHHGTLVQRPHMTARELKVNATNICVKIEGGLKPGTHGWTVALWFKSTAYSAGSQSLYSQIGLHEAHVKDGRLSYLWSPSTGWVGDRDFPVTLGRWHHVAVVYDKRQRVMYKDGEAVFSEDVTGDMGANTNPLLLSARAGSDVPYQFFNGELADVRIYGRALNAAEVAALARMKRDR